MDFLNKAFAQVSDLFKSMTPGARITAGLLLAAVVISLAYLFNHQVSVGDGYLMGGRSFSADELPAMEAALGDADLSYQLEGGKLRVPNGRQNAYMAALAEKDALPADWGTTLLKSVQGSPFMSRQEQEANQKVHKQLALAEILQGWSGVERASVMIDEQKKAPIGQRAALTAAVSIKLRGNVSLDEDQVPDFQRFLAGAVAGLDPQSVTVTDVNSSRTYGGGHGAASAGANDPYFAQTVKYQEMYEAKARDALSYIPQVTVTAHVELEKELRRRQEETKLDPKTVAVSRRESSQNRSTEGGGPAGRPGPTAQLANQPARVTDGGKGPSTTEEGPNTVEEEFDTTRTRTEMETAGLTPKLVKFAIGVPTDYFEKVWMERNRTPEGSLPTGRPDASALLTIETAEKANIESHIRTLVPNIDALVNPLPLVNVTAFTPVTIPEAPLPGMGPQILDWLYTNWSTLGMMLLAAFSLVMLRSMVRAAPMPAPARRMMQDTPAQPASATDIAMTADEPAKTKNRLKRKIGSGASLREELSDMVREDPDAAANILRGWIGDAT